MALWFMLAPSPVSLVQYAILTWFLSRYLIKKVEYRRAPQLFSLIDGFMIVALFVLIGDLFWCLFCILKWLPLFPWDLIQIVTSLLRNVVGIILFFLLIGDHFFNGVLTFGRSVKFWLLIMFLSQGIWFLWAPSPAYTDYVFAWRHGYSFETIFTSFLLSHFVMRIPLWMSIFSAFKNGRKPKEKEEPEW